MTLKALQTTLLQIDIADTQIGGARRLRSGVAAVRVADADVTPAADARVEAAPDAGIASRSDERATPRIARTLNTFHAIIRLR